jgi:hypothetical protein
MLEATTRIELNPEVIHRDLSEGAVLLHGISGQYHGLNQVGTLIWEYLEDSGAVAFGDVVEAVADSVENTPSGFEGEVSEFIEGLAERDLVDIR